MTEPAGSFGYSHKYFSNKTGMAVQFQEVVAKAGYPTVLIEIAPFKGTTADWADKWLVHVARSELHAVASVMLGFKQECEFKYHGSAKKNVSYKLKRQENGLWIQIRNAGHARDCEMPIDRSLWPAMMIVAAIVKNAPPGIPESMIIPLIQRTQ